MFAIEDRFGAILVNISGIKKGMWKGYNNTKRNIYGDELEDITDYLIKYGFKKVIEYDTGVNALKNIDKTYFLIRENTRENRRYYFNLSKNFTEYDKKKLRSNKYIIMGLIVLNEGIINKNQAYIIDWIHSYYKNTITAKTMIDILESYYQINLIPADILCNPDYWSKYLFKHSYIENIEDFKNHLWKSSKNIENYYEIGYNIKAYENIYFSSKDDIITEYDRENITIFLIYDY